MEKYRYKFEKFYTKIKPTIFYLTRKDPEKAHKLFLNFLKTIHKINLDKLILDWEENKISSGIQISNAAGLNKNGEIPSSIMKYLGFERNVIGAVTYDPWKGNPKPRAIRYPKTESIINWASIPGIGAKKVAEKIKYYTNLPLTINIAPTPKKEGKTLLEDLEKTILTLRDHDMIDRFELDISCPNTHSSKGNIDTRIENQDKLKYTLDSIEPLIHPHQSLYLKISPDLTNIAIKNTIDTIKGRKVKGITTTNVTTDHNEKYIQISPEKGGASGKAVYKNSLKTQKKFQKLIENENLDLEIIACGGIDSIEKLQERIDYEAKEIQLYTPMIFKGPQLIREFKKYAAENIN